METKTFSIILLFLSVVFSVFLLEAVLRLTGHTPWTPAGLDSNEPTIHEPDPALGWKNKEGKYVIPGYDSSGKNIHVTFISHGQRLTSAQETTSNKELVIVGGSWTQGMSMDDNETYPWKLQIRYPSFNVLNYGTGGYGSYQSLLVLEKELPRLTYPVIVLYGFIQHHEDRNVAPYGWLNQLSQLSRRGHVFLPYGTLEEDKRLVRNTPERYLVLPLRESLATVSLIEKAYMSIKTKHRHSQKRLVTEQVLLEMKRITEQYGATFVPVLLQADREAKRHYKEFFQTHNIRDIDCVFPLTFELKVSGEGHPNGKMNSLWAECIASALGDQREIEKWSNQGMQPTRHRSADAVR
jgi:hypothetical protein